ncbi:MAG: class I SAM-dependent methyltransferase [Actinobacteria bacterium]|nr:class I SAM-dependent methyltransferase [Actinomycetota bacterium]
MVDRQHRAAWDDWGTVDPFWAVLTHPDARHGRWDHDAFFATGVDMVATMLEHTGCWGRPGHRRTALDFGCGLGRITRALAPHFERTIGLDVASTMIDEARRLDAGPDASDAEFVVHDADDLRAFETGSIDFVSCLLVLQHLPTRAGIETYLREFVRVLAPSGVAAVQLPVHVPQAAPRTTLRQKLRLRTRAGRFFRALRVSPRLLYKWFGWQPEMRMQGIPYEETVAVIESAGGSVLDVSDESTDPGGVVSRVYFVVPPA